MTKSLFMFFVSAACLFAQARVSPDKESAMKADLAGQIDGMKKQAQVMVDSVFSFAELGFQEFETSSTSPPSSKRKASAWNATSQASRPRSRPPGVKASR